MSLFYGLREKVLMDVLVFLGKKNKDKYRVSYCNFSIKKNGMQKFLLKNLIYDSAYMF